MFSNSGLLPEGVSRAFFFCCGGDVSPPRDLRHRGSICGEAQRLEVSLEVPIANGIKGQPREWRRAAACQLGEAVRQRGKAIIEPDGFEAKEEA